MAVYAVDFDGTLAQTRFPEIIAPNKKNGGICKDHPGSRPQSHIVDKPGQCGPGKRRGVVQATRDSI